MWRKKYFLVLIFCIFSLLWSGCSSLKFKNHKIEKKMPDKPQTMNELRLSMGQPMIENEGSKL